MAMASGVDPLYNLRRVLVFRIPHRRKLPKRFSFRVMKDEPAASPGAEEDHISGDLHPDPRSTQLEFTSSRPYSGTGIPQIDPSASRSILRFHLVQPSRDRDGAECEHKRVFGCFIAREAFRDDEFLMAAWLRAKSHWEDYSDVRHIETYQRQFAEQEFNSLKRRCSRQQSDKCICLIVIKKDESVKDTLSSNIMGTMDLNIRQPLYGETFPGELMKAPTLFNVNRAAQPRYAYVANLCVAKHARRQGIAINMLLLAIEAAKSYGCFQMFVHVNKDNIAAQKLYNQIGFQMVKSAGPCLLGEDKYLLRLKI